MSLRFELLDPERVMALPAFSSVEAFLRSSRRTQIGWHYWIDLAWILDELAGLAPGSQVLDAGGGAGPTQFLLAELGFDVTNLDLHFEPPPQWQVARYAISARRLESFERTSYSQHIEAHGRPGLGTRLRSGLRTLPGLSRAEGLWRGRALERWRRGVGCANRPPGKLSLVTANLIDAPEIETARFDAVVSLSALEHVPLAALPSAVSELRRMVKPDGLWAVTTSASTTHDTWWHAPSRGQCFSRTDIERLFSACEQRCVDPRQLLEKYRRCEFLRANLADFYRRGGDNGMPWGIWDPKYVPVGISRRHS
jgi:SAM-dependent methyltransferase